MIAIFHRDQALLEVVVAKNYKAVYVRIIQVHVMNKIFVDYS